MLCSISGSSSYQGDAKDDSFPCGASMLCNSKRWKSAVKRKVALRIGYVGTNYKGLQMQRDAADLITIEHELEKAIFKAGGIIESNFGNLDKIGWKRSSRTDKGVHSLATVIAMKMEVPDNAWVDDPDGLLLADIINSHLPYNIRIFSIVPINKGFDARRACISRKYIYLLPAEIIGIEENSSSGEIEDHIRKFRDILKNFEGRHPFHNYTVRAQYRKQKPKKVVKSRQLEALGEKVTIEDLQSVNILSESARNTGLTNGPERQSQEINIMNVGHERSVNSSETVTLCSNASDVQRNLSFPRARWLYVPDAADKLSAAHFRKILSCSCSNIQATQTTRYIEITVHGESFMFHQIRKMVGTAVAVKRSVLPEDIIKISLSRFSRVVLPLAPSEVLILSDNEFLIPKDPSKNQLSCLSTTVEARVHEFYSSVLLPELEKFLDPSGPLWKEWQLRIDQKSNIPDSDVDTVRKAWTLWYERQLSRRQEGSLQSDFSGNLIMSGC
eukprot:TRINITY_DN1445_c0_g1_i1.p1 TRINITY_DN1445_c0_g1~~TRINITY_DN1445_c0_g1_i1.p1  ORF type:complete len:500 (+),score=79.37 TRINITY_DN1445_c0_g1_i1:167-1666(+)